MLHSKTHASASLGVGPICDDVSTTRTPAALACVKTSPTTGRTERGMEVESGLFIKLQYRQSTWDSRRSAQIAVLRVIQSLEAPTPGSSNTIKAFTIHALLKVNFLKLFSRSEKDHRLIFIVIATFIV